jgi:xanthosine utilization system XapX-like protein
MRADDGMLLIFLGSIIVIALILRLEEGLSDLRRPRSLAWGRGRWRLVAWGQVRLSSGTRGLLAVGLALALVAGGLSGLALALLAVGSVPVFCALAGALGILVALWGMRRAWRQGERHRWPERWSEAPPPDVTGLGPPSPAVRPVPAPPSPTAAGRGAPLT